MPTIVEVLQQHCGWSTVNPDGIWQLICHDCGAVLGTTADITAADPENEPEDAFHRAYAVHQAEMLQPVLHAVKHETWAEGASDAVDRHSESIFGCEWDHENPYGDGND